MTLYTIAITLILVMDPLGNIPVFLAILQNYDTRTQTRIILRESLIAFLILALFVFFGRYILHGLHITTPALSIAGGVILFIIALRMIFPSEQKTSKKEDLEEPLIVPLAVPLTAGPSAMGMVLLFVTRDPYHLWLVFLGVLIASAIFTVIMLFAPFLMKILGKRGLIAIERLMGMILTTIAVQMFLSGVAQYLHDPLL
ncbi:MarC family protein [Coxiella-like endosymbiont]|uniref:MarC family protein n=1 Tax=Coxiella-like endosymbiont TaxID=1592897 RepID=UPI0028695CE0|nr:MarC family protein [Coxiella-like endosymbiont]